MVESCFGFVEIDVDCFVWDGLSLYAECFKKKQLIDELLLCKETINVN